MFLLYFQFFVEFFIRHSFSSVLELLFFCFPSKIALQSFTPKLRIAEDIETYIFDKDVTFFSFTQS